MRRFLTIVSAAVFGAVLAVFSGSRILPDGTAHSQAAAIITTETTSSPAETVAPTAQARDMADECAKYMSQIPGMPKVTADQMRGMMNGMMGSMMPGGSMMPPTKTP